ncbi:uncharacterized protein LOC118989212 [Sturnira hondurensis]|uniref:uncharacterized protein LOC118989212 n=1 Tax=Sturnira hondurensis TaxID=192404 RepID=UPI00187909DC|nr:uncharacterized protein LOC118989212 [Sturnira hondurensis]
MAQAATPGDLGLPCSPKQALALYQHLFRCPVGLGQLRAALRQVQEGQACPPGLELPAVLLEMERSQRAQEQLLWDLELLTGAGLGLFWPPRVQVSGLRDQAQHAWSQHSEPCGGMGADPRQRMSGSSGCSSPQAGNNRSQHHRFLEGRGQAAGGSSAPDPGEAGSDVAPRWESPGMPAEPTPGCLPEPDPTTCSSFGKPGNSEFKDPGGGPGTAEQQADEARELGADGSERFPVPLEEWRDAAEGPKALKAAWPRVPGKEKASGALSAAQRESTLQRLLELQGAARRRRWQDREQQRLRVLDRLRIARNRLCRVHPLGPPPSPAQLQPQARPPGRRW